MIPKLEVLVCTFGAAGLRRCIACEWPHVEGVRYLVCVQNPGNEDILPPAGELHDRGDTLVLFFDDRGLSANRNHALDAASAPYLAIMDDDLKLDASGLELLIREFESNPDVDLITTYADIDEDSPRRLPPAGHDLNKPWPFYWPVSFEIAVRRSALERSGVRFSPLAGIGAPRLGAGEENLFVHHLLKAGLKGRYSGIRIGHHDHPTTTVRAALDPATVRAKGAVMRIMRGNIEALVRIPLEAHRSPMPFFKALRHLAEGFIYSIKHRREL